MVVAEWLGWRWIHTAGHTHGPVVFVRDVDRVLIARDAVSRRGEPAGRSEHLWVLPLHFDEGRSADSACRGSTQPRAEGPLPAASSGVTGVT